MRKKSTAKQVGKPSIYVREKFACWKYDDIKKKKNLFLPGGVMKSDAGDIPCIIPTAMIKMSLRETISIQFQQATSKAHLIVTSEIEEIRAKGFMQEFGMYVTSTTSFGNLIERVDRRKDGRIGQVEICFWLKVKGHSRPIKLTPIKAYIHGKRHIGAIRLYKVPASTVFCPTLFCPEWWCANPYCHSHWYWFPGVPASTACGGGCIIGGPCQCWISLPGGGGWAANCPGLKLCWC